MQLVQQLLLTSFLNTAVIVHSYDYIVAGAGSAGSVIAAKLAKGGHDVLLLEAGPDDDWVGSDVVGNPTDPYQPEDYNNIQYTPEIDDAVMSEPVWEFGRQHDPRLALLVNLSKPVDKYREFLPRAKIVGGCSMHNFMYYYRGSPQIYDSWGKDWSWNVLFPKFRAIETDLEPDVDPAYHGSDGENVVSTREPWLTEAGKAFMRAAVKAGYPYNKDLNGASLVGIGPAPTSTFQSKRWSASKGFLTQKVRSLKNFHLITGAMVSKVIFEGKRAVGVAYTKNGKNHTVAATKEIVLSLGAYRSPQILMLSGIGPTDVLGDLGIPQVAVNDGVGKNLQDHLMVPAFATTPPSKLKSNSTYAPFGGYFFSSWCKERKCSMPDLEWMCGHVNGNEIPSNDESYLACMVALTRPESRPGFLTLKSKDPRDYPAIYHNYLGAQEDIGRLAWAVKETCRVYSQDDMFGPQPAALGGDLCAKNITLELLDSWVKRTATTVYHPVGTCKMGSSIDDGAVVDSSLKVYGVDGLRVADASVMPVIPNVNTDAPSRMVGYHVADMILEEARRGARSMVVV